MKLWKIIAGLLLISLCTYACTKEEAPSPQEDRVLSNEEVRIGFAKIFQAQD
ncbi:MAG: hypothetical protein AAGG75_19390 [Bacteroidota bacterium]